MPALNDVAAYLDQLLDSAATPDYPQALNGLQLANAGEVRKVGAAVDFSRRTVDGAVTGGVNLLLVHHGMFWGGLQPIRGAHYERLKALIAHDVAVYASHLPLDRHPDYGNNALLARALGLEPSGAFAQFKGIAIGVRGEADEDTSSIVERAQAFAAGEGGTVTHTRLAPHQRTRRWAICTGAGASSDTLREAAALEIDTLLVGEGPHHTAVEAEELGITILYAGHYATETLGVRALAQHLGERYGLPWMFIAAPTGT